MKSFAKRALAMMALLLCRPEAARACAACFGKSDSALAKGMNMGIFTLLAVIVGVLGVLSCFFVFLAVRSSRAPQLQPPSETNSPDQTAQS